MLRIVRRGQVEETAARQHGGYADAEHDRQKASPGLARNTSIKPTRIAPSTGQNGNVAYKLTGSSDISASNTITRAFSNVQTLTSECPYDDTTAQPQQGQGRFGGRDRQQEQRKTTGHPGLDCHSMGNGPSPPT